MTVKLTEEQAAIKQMVREFARKELAPTAFAEETVQCRITLRCHGQQEQFHIPWEEFLASRETYGQRRVAFVRQ